MSSCSPPPHQQPVHDVYRLLKFAFLYHFLYLVRRVFPDMQELRPIQTLLRSPAAFFLTASLSKLPDTKVSSLFIRCHNHHIIHAALQELLPYTILNTHQTFLLYLKISAVTRLQIQEPGKSALYIFSKKHFKGLCKMYYLSKTAYRKKRNIYKKHIILYGLHTLHLPSLRPKCGRYH